MLLRNVSNGLQCTTEFQTGSVFGQLTLVTFLDVQYLDSCQISELKMSESGLYINPFQNTNLVWFKWPKICPKTELGSVRISAYVVWTFNVCTYLLQNLAVTWARWGSSVQIQSRFQRVAILLVRNRRSTNSSVGPPRWWQQRLKETLTDAF